MIDADVLRAQIAQIDSGVDTAFLVLRDLEVFLDEMFCELRDARRKSNVRTTTVVEQLIAGAGIDYQARISDNGESSIIVCPNRGDSTPESVIRYGVDAILEWDYDEIHGGDDFDTRVWLLHRIKELNPNFVLDYTWY